MVKDTVLFIVYPKTFKFLDRKNIKYYAKIKTLMKNIRRPRLIVMPSYHTQV